MAYPQRIALILEKKLLNVKIELDSILAVTLINEGQQNQHPQSAMINEAHYLMTRTHISIKHTYRSANQYADHLA